MSRSRSRSDSPDPRGESGSGDSSPTRKPRSSRVATPSGLTTPSPVPRAPQPSRTSANTPSRGNSATSDRGLAWEDVSDADLTGLARNVDGAPVHTPDDYAALLGPAVLSHLGRPTSELNSVKTGLRNFFEERQIDSDGTLAIMSSDATTFDLNLKPVDGLTKPAAMCLQHIAGLVERLRRVDNTLSLAEGVLVPALTEFLLSHESQHPRRYDAGSSVGRGGNTYPRSNHGSVHAGDTASSSKYLPEIVMPPVPADAFPDVGFQRRVRDTFKQHGVAEFLTNEALCAANERWSESFAARIIGCFRDSNVLGYLAISLEDDTNCARVWKSFVAQMTSHDSEAVRFRKFWNELFNLKCEDLDSFPVYFSKFSIALQRLEELGATFLDQKYLGTTIIARGVLASELQSTLDSCRKSDHGMRKTLKELSNRHQTLRDKLDLRDSTASSVKSRRAEARIPKKAKKPDSSKVPLVPQDRIFPMKDFPKNGPENKFHEQTYGQFKKWFAFKTLVAPKLEEKKEFAEWKPEIFISKDKKKEIHSELDRAKGERKAKADQRKALRAHRDHLQSDRDYGRSRSRSPYSRDRDRYYYRSRSRSRSPRRDYRASRRSHTEMAWGRSSPRDRGAPIRGSTQGRSLFGAPRYNGGA